MLREGGSMSKTKDEAIEAAVEHACTRCGSDDMSRVHHRANFALPECWWWNCDDCGYMTEPE